MKLKKIFVVFSLLLALFAVTGCSLFSKKAVTSSRFKTVAENNNLTIIDAKSQMSEYEFILEALIAKAADDWQIEFYVLSTNNEAKDMYDTNRKKFEDSKSGTVKEKFMTVREYSMYDLESGGYYMHLTKVDNTLLYVKVPSNYKENAKKIIKDLGY